MNMIWRQCQSVPPPRTVMQCQSRPGPLAQKRPKDAETEDVGEDDFPASVPPIHTPVFPRKRSVATSLVSASTSAPPPFVRANSAPEPELVYPAPSKYVLERRARIQQPIDNVSEEQNMENEDTLSLRSLPQLMDQRMDRISRLRIKVRESHPATEEWYKAYESYEIGTIPPSELCENAPETQKVLARVPIKKSTNKTGILMHFFTLVRLEGYDAAVGPGKAKFLKHRCVVAKSGESGEAEEICGAEYSTGGNTGKIGHMNKEHNDLWLALSEFRKYQEMVRGEEVLQAVGETAPLGARYEVVRQEQIASNMRKPTERDILDFHDNLLSLVTEAGAPFSQLAHPSMKKLCRDLNAHFTIPTIPTLQKRLKATTQSAKTFIKSFLTSQLDKVSLTLDGWSSRDRRKFLGITCHFFSRSSGMVSFIIGMERIHGRQTAINIMDALDRVVRDWGLHNRVSGITTDQGANVKLAMTLYNNQVAPIAWIPCASHKIQLCINNALKRQSSVFAIFQKCKDISAVFAESSAATDILNSQQKRHFDGKQWNLLTFNKTRWNSWFTMSARVHKLLPAITASLCDLESGTRDLKMKANELREVMLCDDEAVALGEMLALLQPAADFTHWAGHASKPTLSHVYARAYSILPAVESFTTPQARALHRSLDYQIKESWPLTNVPDAILLAIYFNPACASSKFLMDTEIDGKSLLNRAKELAGNLVVEHLTRRHKEAEEIDPDPFLDETMGLILRANSQGYAFLALNVYGAFCSSEAYTKKFMDCPQDFWLQHRSNESLMSLCSIALSYLCIQATSSDSERAFSQAGLILDKKRASMADHNFQAVLFARSFAKAIPEITKIHAVDEAVKLDARRNMNPTFHYHRQ
ncbi:hypothetical protein EMPS_08166 [Entomortierella parvispora]|uniref:HAT C-terminal dimerisation domain-containing protein n=1 Tax=Entomortierella parvispora TaxID=205924 RepID=A0A9P3HFW0_9FUNG|nr:hypothetical protein EMPS_08166 [Entomortierella parvispora]